jgi:hypothetical protein
MLTGKAKEDFLEWYWITEIEPLRMTICKKIDLEQFFDTIVPTLKRALIIDWFDSVGYTIDRNSYDKKMTITNWTDGKERQTVIDCDYLKPFSEWWEAAIIEANRIYNQS